MVHKVPPSLAALTAAATVVLLGGVVAVAVVPGTASSALPTPASALPSAEALPVEVPSAEAPSEAALPLAVQPAAALPAAASAGNPATWPTRQLAAQLVFSCVNTGDLATAVAHAQAGIGGIVVQGRPTDGAALTAGLASVRAAAPDGIAPLVASDEEGGRVQRLSGLLGPLPSAAVMGGWPDAQIERTAQDYGAGMRALGVQMALSPVADLAAAGGHPADTGRAFSADPRRVAGAAVAWSRGLDRVGVLSSVKHWPGHGSGTDSHTTAPEVLPLAALEGSDLLPFDAVLGSGASVVMVGHLRSAGLTEPGLPATLSPNALRVLRERAGPRTVVLTDSLSMAASSSALGLVPAAAAVRSLQAGADWAMSCVDPFAAVDAVQAALDSGSLPREAAVASARRILDVKQRVGLLAVAPTTAAPTGAVEAAELAGGVVTLRGRATDPDTAEPPRVQVLSDGVAVTEVPAAAGTSTFVVAVPAPSGAQVCALALNTGAGPPTPLGCVTRP